MPLYVNAISLAEKLRTPRDQVSFLQRHRILPSSYTCPDCNLTCEEAKLKHGRNYFYFHCPGCNAQTSVRFVCCCCCCFLFCLICFLQDRNHSFWKGDHVENICSHGLLLCGDDTYSPTTDPRGRSAMWRGWRVRVEHWDKDQLCHNSFLPQDIQVWIFVYSHCRFKFQRINVLL